MAELVWHFLAFKDGTWDPPEWRGDYSVDSAERDLQILVGKHAGMYELEVIDPLTIEIRNTDNGNKFRWTAEVRKGEST